MFRFLQAYTRWHYTRGTIALAGNLMNMVTFLWRLFSIPNLLRTLLAPLRRLHEEYKDDLDIQAAASTFIVNMIMRLVGAVVRIGIIVFAVVVILISIVISPVVLAVWLLLPLLYLFLIGLFIRTLT